MLFSRGSRAEISAGRAERAAERAELAAEAAEASSKRAEAALAVVVPFSVLILILCMGFALGLFG